MIQLTRLGHGDTFFVNPDLFERVDSHVDTVVRLTNGNEYVVQESAAQIIERVVLYRAHVLAAVPIVAQMVANGEPLAAYGEGDAHREIGPGAAGGESRGYSRGAKR